MTAVSAAFCAGDTASSRSFLGRDSPLKSRLLPLTSLRRLVAGVAVVAGFAAVSTPARADDGTGTTTVGGYTVTTDPTGTTDPSSYGKAGDGTTSTDPSSYGKAGDGTTSTTTTTTSPDSYGKS
jgi:hypothetical protein